MRVIFPPVDPPGGIPPIRYPAVPGQATPSLPTPQVQPPPTLTPVKRQYPNLDPKWFTSKEAHGGMVAAIRSLYDMNYDLQDGIKLLTTSNPGTQVSMQPLPGSGAMNPSQRAHYLVTSPTAAALTLGHPRAQVDDGTEITVTSASAAAHTITTVGALATGSAAVNTATFAAFAGASVHLRAQGGKFNVLSSTGVSFS